MLVHNYYNDVFVTGSFWTYDGYDLKDSVLIGNKLIWWKWGSSYWIESGTVENGPAIRNISAFPIDIDKKDGTVYAFLPDSKIPPYGKQKIVPQAKLNLENYVIIGDTLTTLGAIVALRATYDSKIQIIPDGFKKNGFINTKFLIESLQPKDIEDQYIVDSDFLEKNYCEYFPEKTTQDIMQIDNHKKKILFRDGTELEYTKCLIAWGSRKENTFDNYENAFTLNSVYDHAKIYNHIKTAKTIVIYGNTFETYELASSARQLANSFGNTNSIVYLIEPPPGEVFRSFGENVHKSIKAMLFVNKINVLTDYLIVDQKSDINGNKLEKLILK